MESAIRVHCPPPHHLTVFSRKGLVNDRNVISPHGTEIVEAACNADVALIDWEMEEAPEINTLCYRIRRRLKVPVLMLCKGGSEAMAASIGAGADDALTFPFSFSYLQAKVFAYRRLMEVARASGSVDDTPRHTVLEFDQLKLDLSAHRFWARDTEIELTPREFTLLTYLVRNAETLCTREDIQDSVWGINFDTGTNMVDVYMYFLRKKLEAHGLKGMIKTVRGHGYRLRHIELAE